MRNNRRAASPFRWMLRRYIFLMIAVLAITFAVFPMQGMIRILNAQPVLRQEASGLVDSAARQYMALELSRDFVYSPLNLEMLCGLFGAMGFLAAMVLFRHLFSRKQGMMYAALPMKRERDFGLRTGVFAVCSLLPMVLCMAVYPVMIHANGLGGFFRLPLYLEMAGAALLIHVYGFALGALCACAAGTVWSAGLGAILLAGSAEAVLYGWLWIGNHYLNTLQRDTIRRAMLRFSPAYSLYKAFYRPGTWSVLPGVLAIGLFLGLAVWARKRVKPENAGHTLNLKGLEPALLGWLSILGGTAAAMVLTLYWDREIIVYPGVILGAAGMFLLARMLLDQRIRLSLRGWKIPAAAAAGLLLLCLGLRADVFGYNRYAPRAEDLKSVRIMPYLVKSEEMTFDTPEGIEACLQWVAQSRQEMEEERKEKPYQGTEAAMVVFFDGKDGGFVTRQYHFPKERQALIPAMRVMTAEWGRYQSEHLPRLPQASAYSFISDYSIPAGEFRDLFGFQRDTRFHPRAAELREALKKDLAARTLESMQEPTVLQVSLEGQDPDSDSPDAYRYVPYDIKPADRHTLELLLGGDADKWIDYVRGGFARCDQVRVFRCAWEQDGEDWKAVSWRPAESGEEVREWMAGVSLSNDEISRWPTDPADRIQIYSLYQLRERMEWDEELVLDLEDPETLRNLPGIENAGGPAYAMRIPEAG